MVWYVFWVIVISNDPADDKFMTTAEKAFLKEKITFMGTEKVIKFFNCTILQFWYRITAAPA